MHVPANARAVRIVRRSPLLALANTTSPLDDSAENAFVYDNPKSRVGTLKITRLLCWCLNCAGDVHVHQGRGQRLNDAGRAGDNISIRRSGLEPAASRGALRSEFSPGYPVINNAFKSQSTPTHLKAIRESAFGLCRARVRYSSLKSSQGNTSFEGVMSRRWSAIFPAAYRLPRYCLRPLIFLRVMPNLPQRLRQFRMFCGEEEV